MLRNVLILSAFAILFSFTPGVSSLNYTLVNGTGLYLATGEPKNIEQGYVLTLKSVNREGAVWIQLSQNDTFIKSEILLAGDYFYYNKSNRTIISFKVDNVYSGSPEKNLVSLYPVYQYLDYGLPLTISANPEKTLDPVEVPSGEIYTNREPLFWALGIFILLILLYAMRRLW